MEREACVCAHVFDRARWFPLAARTHIVCYRLLLASRDATNLWGETMKFLLLFVAWCVLFVLSWPIALLALLLWPLFWLLSLPFRLIGITFDALFALLKAILMLPARLFGYRVKP